MTLPGLHSTRESNLFNKYLYFVKWEPKEEALDCGRKAACRIQQAAFLTSTTCQVQGAQKDKDMILLHGAQNPEVEKSTVSLLGVTVVQKSGSDDLCSVRG
jgi:hypothetical protein